MSIKRRVEVFSAGDAICNSVVDAVRRESDPSCEVIVQSTLDSRVLARADELGIRCTAREDIGELLKNAGLGKG